jgi:hypothetical protein
MFLRHQNIMKHDLLLLNTLIITAFAMIVDHFFIHNHLTIIQPLSDQYFDSTDMKLIEKELDKEIQKEDILIEKIKKKDEKKEKKKSRKEKKIQEELDAELIKEANIDLNKEDFYNEQLYDNYPEDYNEQQENPYYNDNEDYRIQKRPDRLRVRTPEKHYAFSEPLLDNADNILAYNS